MHPSLACSETWRTSPYPVRNIHDDTGKGVFYVNAKRKDQNRTLFFAFNYSHDGGDGGIRVKGVNSVVSQFNCGGLSVAFINLSC